MAPLDVPELIRTLTVCGLAIFGVCLAWRFRDRIANFWDPLQQVKGLGFELTKVALPPRQTPEEVVQGIVHHEAINLYDKDLQALWNERLQNRQPGGQTYEQFLELPNHIKELVLAPLNRDIEDFSLRQAGFDAQSFNGPVNLELKKGESIFVEPWLPYKRHMKKGNRTLFFTWARLEAGGETDQILHMWAMLMTGGPAFVASEKDDWQVILAVLDPTDGEAYARFRGQISATLLPAIENGRLLLVPVSIQDEKIKELVVISMNTVIDHIMRQMPNLPATGDGGNLETDSPP